MKELIKGFGGMAKLLVTLWGSSNEQMKLHSSHSQLTRSYSREDGHEIHDEELNNFLAALLWVTEGCLPIKY